MHPSGGDILELDARTHISAYSVHPWLCVRIPNHFAIIVLTVEVRVGLGDKGYQKQKQKKHGVSWRTRGIRYAQAKESKQHIIL